MRIAVRGGCLNFADLLARAGLSPAAPPLPFRPGYEVAGEVEAIGDGVSGLAIDNGDGGRPFRRSGGTGHRSPPRRDAVAERLSFEQGAAFCVNYATAYAALIIMGGLRASNRVLIHSAAGGGGIACTQVAHNVGAEIFGTASAAKHEAIRAQGVDHPIDYRSQDFSTEVRELTTVRAVKSDRCEGDDLVPQGLPHPGTGGPRSCADSPTRSPRRARSIPAASLQSAAAATSTMPWWNPGRS